MRTLHLGLGVLAGVASLAAGLSAAVAHHAGGIANTQGAGPINTITATTLEQGQGVAVISVDYTHLEGLSDGTLLQAGEGVHDLRTIQSYALGLAFGLTTDLMLTVQLPFVRRTGIREAEGNPPDVEALGNADGLGDLAVLGQYRFFRQGGLEAAALFGVKAPTGETDARTLEGHPFHAEFQPGSGSWDGLVGFAVTQRLGAWSFDGNLLYAIVTEGTQDTDLGDRLQFNAAVSYRLTSLGPGPLPMFHGAHSHAAGDDGHHGGHRKSGGPVLDAVLELNGEWHAKEVELAIKNENSGGTVIYLSPGLRLSFEDWSSFVSCEIPIVNELNGIQSTPDWRILSGITVGF